MTGSALHRVAQFWRHTSARISTAELARSRDLLGPALSRYFLELPVNDQRHGLDVLETLRRNEPEASLVLQQAALLHDMGKAGAGVSVVERSAAVFLRAAAPRVLEMLLHARPGFARRYGIYRDHARIGAERLHAAGAVELAAVVAEHHAPHPTLDLTRRLQRADGAN